MKMFEIDDGEIHWVMAESLEQALEEIEEHFGDPVSCNAVTKELKINKKMTIHLYDEDEPTTKIITEWFEFFKNRPQLIASTVYADE